MNLNELTDQIQSLVCKVERLESQVNAFIAAQGGEIPPGMAPLISLAAEFGISTKKAEELAQNTGVMLIRQKSGGFIVNDAMFRASARQVLRAAKRKYGSAYWYHPILGKFQMSGGIPQ